MVKFEVNETYFGGKVIKDLPDKFDPVILIEKRMLICPFCKKQVNKYVYYPNQYSYRDKKGKRHKIFTFLNKYEQKKYTSITCPICGTNWETEWFPCDHKMFEVKINS